MIITKQIRFVETLKECKSIKIIELNYKLESDLNMNKKMKAELKSLQQTIDHYDLPLVIALVGSDSIEIVRMKLNDPLFRQVLLRVNALNYS